MAKIARTAFPADIVVHDGLAQSQRGLPGQKSGYFNVHEMSFPALLTQAVDYSRLMMFYTAADSPDGDWGGYFSRDETVVIASILAFDLVRATASLEADLAQTAQQPLHYLKEIDLPPHGVRARKMSSYVLARAIDGWRAALVNVQSREGVELRHLVESVIEGLSGELRAFMQMIVAARARGPEQTAAAQGSLEKIFTYNFPNVWFGASEADAQEITPFLLRSNFHSFAKAVEMIQSSAARLLEPSMENQAHDPAVGMLIAFVKMFHGVQRRINRFTQDRLDFYYDDVLRARPRGFTPDSAILVLRPGVKGGEVAVPRGTAFLAGTDAAKRNIVYASQTDLLVNDLTVSALYTLYLQRDPLNFPENKFMVPGDTARGQVGQRQMATGSYLDQVPINTALDPVLASRTAQPLLGAPKGTGVSPSKAARLGFALASRVLLLQEGQRAISVTIRFGGEMSLEEQIAKLTLILKQQSGRRDGSTIESDAETFFRVFQDMFTLSLTTAAGWFDLLEYLPSYSKVEHSIKANSLVLKFSLPAGCPAITGYVPKVHGENYETDLPVLRCTISSGNYLYGYDFLGSMVVRDVRLDVDVRGCRNLLVYNQVGQLAPLSPFAPFGPIPTVGSYLIIGSAEIAPKQLTAFDVDIEWGNLPPGPGGFVSYYRAYGEIDNGDFQVRPSLLIDGKWSPSDNDGVPPVPLFESMDDDSIGGQANLPCDDIIHYYKPLAAPSPSGDFTYTPATRGGFFKFTLCGPKGAFGHQEYPALLSKTLTANARQKSPQLMEPVPNPPYTPTIASIELHYAAFSTINPARAPDNADRRAAEQFIQLHPLGWENMHAADVRSVYLLPQFPMSGNLAIGLQGSRIGGPLSLFFHLREDSLPMERAHAKAPQWRYLRNNRWTALTPKQVVMDTTEGFMTSGIVTLDLPDDAGKDNTVLPGGMFWLQLCAEHDLEKFCSVYSVYAQAVQASWQFDPDAASIMPSSIDAGTIDKTLQPLPGIVKIAQLMPSWGARVAESVEQMRIRTAERLRHKNRALTAADYEMLILERFPSIYRVKCFANMVAEIDPAKRIRPGCLLIVPVPYVPPTADASQMPVLSGHLINELREFVMALAPQFATIKVGNPAYEQIQVRCTVKLRKGLRGGRYTGVLNKAISDFLSPWKSPGYTAHFGWCVRQHDIESYIQDQDYIDDVTKFSMLRVAPDFAPDGSDNDYELLDTAAHTHKGTSGRSGSISPKYPWSIAVPLLHHAIETTDDFTPQMPEAAGVKELEIGATFIVSSGK